MGFKNIFLAPPATGSKATSILINASITRAMQDRRLNHVMAQ